MNIVVNKIMNENYLEKYLTTIMGPTEEYFLNFKTYANMSTDLTVNSASDYSFLLMVPESYLNIINKLNTLNYQGTLDLPGVDFALLMNTLYSKNGAERNAAIDYLVTAGVFTADEVAMAKTLSTDFLNLDLAKMDKAYVDTTIPGNELLVDVIEYTYDYPIELNNKYDIVNNTAGEALYIVVLPLVNKVYGNTDGTQGNYVSTHTYKAGETVALQSSYIAIGLGDINDATADIKYDHVDKIDYIDSFRFRFRLPKVLN